MKLRILGDSVRLRLSKSDVQTLRDHGQVAETVHFGASADAALTYALRLSDDVGEVTARYAGTQISVDVPRAQGVAWAEGDEVLECTGYVTPPDNVEYFLTEIYRSTRESGQGKPDDFEAAFLLHRYRSEFGMLEIPGFVQG